MEIKDKISDINSLNRRIEELKDFLKLCENGHGESTHKDSKGNPQINYFGSMELKAYIWTGTQNPDYSKKISNRDDIALLVDGFKQSLSVLIKKLEAELESKLS